MDCTETTHKFDILKFIYIKYFMLYAKYLIIKVNILRFSDNIHKEKNSCEFAGICTLFGE